ncbi:hypothetical protein IWX50DRAFT_467981 [Phyllosticta citricarpa]
MRGFQNMVHRLLDVVCTLCRMGTSLWDHQLRRYNAHPALPSRSDRRQDRQLRLQAYSCRKGIVMYMAAGSGIPEIETILSEFVIPNFLRLQSPYRKGLWFNLRCCNGHVPRQGRPICAHVDLCWVPGCHVVPQVQRQWHHRHVAPRRPHADHPLGRRAARVRRSSTPSSCLGSCVCVICVLSIRRMRADALSASSSRSAF